jgi:hypothetical protein
LPSRGHIADGAVHAGGDDAAGVAGEAGVFDAGVVAAEDRGVVGDVPAAGGAVGGAGEHAAAVGAEAGGHDAGAVAVEDQRGAGARALPQVRAAAVGCPEEQVGAVGEADAAEDLVQVEELAAEGCPVGGVPLADLRVAVRGDEVAARGEGEAEQRGGVGQAARAAGADGDDVDGPVGGDGVAAAVLGEGDGGRRALVGADARGAVRGPQAGGGVARGAEDGAAVGAPQRVVDLRGVAAEDAGGGGRAEDQEVVVLAGRQLGDGADAGEQGGAVGAPREAVEVGDGDVPADRLDVRRDRCGRERPDARAAVVRRGGRRGGWG